ncbi:helix-turn-helix transcriptional regulator [Clostridium sp.]|uniref:helix-turn-helix domain-containing protein n=1 Tax=Clostridium sp. TaxID=1506 RepID=UPI0025C4D93C|nr:helix-turn-helix transcriptional regulator [Clostridium sp.]
MIALKLERVKKGLTQEELSKKSGVSRVLICNIERNGIENVPVCTLRKLAAALNKSIAQLFFSDEE